MTLNLIIARNNGFVKKKSRIKNQKWLLNFGTIVFFTIFLQNPCRGVIKVVLQ